MPPSKTCPKCSAIVHIRKSACECGHCFSLKRKAPSVTMKSKRMAMRCKRTLESASDTLLRQKKDSTNKAKTIVSESSRYEKDVYNTCNPT